MIHNLGSLKALYQQTLQSHYTDAEIRTITNWIGEDLMGKDLRLLAPDTVLSPAQWQDALKALQRLEAGEPVQYVLGYTLFYGRRFQVSPAVLIPRPETEELIDLVLQQLHTSLNTGQPVRLLDVGTGSGCIAITLWLELQKRGMAAIVTGMDLSPDALTIARQNAASLQAEIDWRQGDMFDRSDFLSGTLDGIVSNPPYVPLRERQEMSPQVVSYEPHMALFVYDNDPLSSYRAIARLGKQSLSKKGQVWVEIHRDFAVEVQSLLEEEGYKKVMIYQDLRKNNRMVSAIISG